MPPTTWYINRLLLLILYIFQYPIWYHRKIWICRQSEYFDLILSHGCWNYKNDIQVLYSNNLSYVKIIMHLYTTTLYQANHCISSCLLLWQISDFHTYVCLHVLPECTCPFDVLDQRDQRESCPQQSKCISIKMNLFNLLEKKLWW